MYRRKLPPDLSCGISLTMEVIGAKWKPCLIDALRDGPKRPSQLHRLVPDASARVLDQCLRALEAQGIVEKTIYPVLPPKSEYALTDVGRSLLPLIDSLEAWGEAHRDFYAARLAVMTEEVPASDEETRVSASDEKR